MVEQSQGSLRKQCFRPGVRSPGCHGHWCGWSGGRVQEDEAVPPGRETALHPCPLERFAGHSQDEDWDRWGHGWQHPSPVQAGRDDPPMQLALGRASSIWRSLEIGMGRVQPTGMGEEDEAAGAYSPRTADSPFRHANLEVPTMHLLGPGHPSPGSTRPSSRPRHRGRWLLGSSGWCSPLVTADSDLVTPSPIPCLWQQLDNEGALWHLVRNAIGSEVSEEGSWSHHEGALGQPPEDSGWGGAVPGCQQSRTAPEFLGVASVLPGVGEVPGDEGLLDEHPAGGDGDPSGSHQWHQRAHDHEGNLRWKDQPSHGSIQGVPGGVLQDRGGHPCGRHDGREGGLALQHLPVLALWSDLCRGRSHLPQVGLQPGSHHSNGIESLWRPHHLDGPRSEDPGGRRSLQPSTYPWVEFRGRAFQGTLLLIHWILTSPANRPGLHKLAPRSQNKRDAFAAEGCCLWCAFIRRTFLVTCWHNL